MSAVVTRFAPPRTRVAVHGELTGDGERIFVMAAGAAEDVAHLAKQLQQLTPLIKPSEPRGALVMPATWQALVQLSAVYGQAWRPGPALSAWTAAQAAARATAGTGTLTAPVPNHLTHGPIRSPAPR